MPTGIVMAFCEERGVGYIWPDSVPSTGGGLIYVHRSLQSDITGWLELNESVTYEFEWHEPSGVDGERLARVGAEDPTAAAEAAKEAERAERTADGYRILRT